MPENTTSLLRFMRFYLNRRRTRATWPLVCVFSADDAWIYATALDEITHGDWAGGLPGGYHARLRYSPQLYQYICIGSPAPGSDGLSVFIPRVSVMADPGGPRLLVQWVNPSQQPQEVTTENGVMVLAVPPAP